MLKPMMIDEINDDFGVDDEAKGEERELVNQK